MNYSKIQEVMIERYPFIEFREENLFNYKNVDNHSVFMQCVPYKMLGANAGIARVFKYNYPYMANDISYIMNYYNMSFTDTKSFMYKPKNGDMPVINLFTKYEYYQKPTLVSLRDSLESASANFMYTQYDTIYMPFIGCGLDKLHFNDVANIIDKCFGDKVREGKLKIIICYNNIESFYTAFKISHRTSSGELAIFNLNEQEDNIND